MNEFFSGGGNENSVESAGNNDANLNLAAEAEPTENVRPEINLTAKNNIYREIAKNALKNWNGLSENDALEAVAGKSVEELEQQVYAGDSIKAAVGGIFHALERRGVKFGDEEQGSLLENILNGSKDDNHSIIRDLKDGLKPMARLSEIDPTSENSLENFTLDVLEGIHTDWIKHNSNKFFDEKRVDKMYQFMPLELIGFKEAKADNLFLAPILEAAGFKVDDERLEKAYEARQQKFFEENDLFARGKLESSRTLQKMFRMNFENEEVPEELKKIDETLTDWEFWRDRGPSKIARQIHDKNIDTFYKREGFESNWPSVLRGYSDRKGQYYEDLKIDTLFDGWPAERLNIHSANEFVKNGISLEKVLKKLPRNIIEEFLSKEGEA